MAHKSLGPFQGGAYLLIFLMILQGTNFKTIYLTFTLVIFVTRGITQQVADILSFF